VDKDGKRKEIGITRAHMEEDAGKLLHLTKTGQIADAEESLVDYNRGGVPLIEIVSEPDMRSSDEAYNYLITLKSILKYIDVSDCNMEEGSLRCDANVSIRPWGQKEFGTKVEIKNMNSFNNVRKAIDYEIERQVKMTEAGEVITQETRLWDGGKAKTFSMRSKEGSHDYRYFPEPDLPPFVLEQSFMDEVKKEIPELPVQKMDRFTEKYSLPLYDAGVLTQSIETADFFEEAASKCSEPKLVSNWMMTELLGRMNEAGIESISKTNITTDSLTKMIALIQKGTISGKIAKTVFDVMFKEGGEPEKIVAEKGLVQISDTGAIEAAVDKILAANPKAVEDIKGGKPQGMGFLVGQIMKETKGKANPQMVNEILKKKLG